MPKVWNKRWKDVPSDAVYVGRPTIFGNPFSHLPETAATYSSPTRELAVEAYRKYLRDHPFLVEKAKRLLKGKDLVCWCKPAACHADVLMEVANDISDRESPEPESPGDS